MYVDSITHVGNYNLTQNFSWEILKVESAVETLVWMRILAFEQILKELGQEDVEWIYLAQDKEQWGIFLDDKPSGTIKTENFRK